MTEQADPTADSTAEPGADTEVATAPAEESRTDAADLAREAGNWRKKYQATRTENETLTGTVAELQRQLVETQIAGRIADPADWWQHTSIDQLVGDNGSVDFDKVDTALSELLTAKPHYAPRIAAAAAFASEVTGNQPIEGGSEATNWSTLLGGNRN